MLGSDFIEEVDKFLAKIEANPLIYTVVNYGIRRAVVQCFPYNVYYLIDANIIHVVAVWHGGKAQTQRLEKRM